MSASTLGKTQGSAFEWADYEIYKGNSWQDHVHPSRIFAKDADSGRVNVLGEIRKVMHHGLMLDDGDPGALVCFDNHRYAKVTNHGFVLLDGRVVLFLLKQFGRPVKLEGRTRLSIYLDQQTRQIAHDLGQGNISEGIRKALLMAAGLDN